MSKFVTERWYCDACGLRIDPSLSTTVCLKVRETDYGPECFDFCKACIRDLKERLSLK